MPDATTPRTPERPDAAARARFAADADARTVADLRADGWEKWTVHPDLVGAFVAEADFGTAPAVRDALSAAVAAQRFGYATVREHRAMGTAFATFAADRYGWPVDPERVRPVADVMSAFRAAVLQFSRPGSAIVLPTPGYMPFLTMPALLGREVVQVPMVRDAGRWVLDLDGIDRALAAGAGTLLLVNPHNPTGRVLDAAELAAVTEVVDRNGARVFADEIHAPLVHPGHRHLPYAAASPAAAAHTVTAVSASKAWNIPGLKAAQLVLSNDPDVATWGRVRDEYEESAATLGVLAATAAYTDGRSWLAEAVDYLDGNRRLMADLVAEHLPGVRFDPPEGTYLAWLDCRDLGLGDHPGAFFAEQAGVAFTDGPLCGAAGRGFVRVTLATPRPVLREIVARMAETLARR